MRVYYRGPYANVTDTVLESWSPTHQRFAIADLTGVDIALAEGPPDSTVFACVNAGALALAFDLAGYRTLGRLWTWALGALIVLAAVGTAVALHRRRSRTLELCGWYRSEYVVLFRCTDDRVFGHVSRALRRSLEHHTDYDTSPGQP